MNGKKLNQENKAKAPLSVHEKPTEKGFSSSVHEL
jgi:hypothetical protein